MIAKRTKGGWNKDLAVGQKRAFSLAECMMLEEILLSEENWHDLALFSFGLDTMFRASDLLASLAEQVTYPNMQVRRLIPRKQIKTKQTVFPVLTIQSQFYLQKWLAVSGKERPHYLFTRNKAIDAEPISRAHFAEIIKGWAVKLGLNPQAYSTHSIRRSKASHMYWNGVDIALISKLLGHKSIASTLDYLSITQQRAEKAALEHPMLRGPKMRD